MISIQSAAEPFRVSETEIATRKRLLAMNPEHLQTLADCAQLVEPQLDAIVDEFYARQLDIPEVRATVGDSHALARLKTAMRDYIARVFGGEYGPDYVDARLRIGRIHASIGVKPMLYVASVHRLAQILVDRLSPLNPDPLLTAAIEKIVLFDLTLAFDSYIQGLVDEVSLARDELAAYARNLERLVDERTASLKRLAETDDLTGLKNRRALMGALNDRVNRPDGPAESFGFAFLDIDNFKEVNDTHGHVAGDRVLQRVAAAFQAAVPQKENVYRYGGDEFVAVFPVSSTRSAPEVARILKARIENQLGGEIAVSIGVSHFPSGKPVSLEEVLRSIDREMYCNKPGSPAAARQMIA